MFRNVERWIEGENNVLKDVAARAIKASPALAGVAFLFRVEEFGESRVFLEEGEIFVVAGMEAIFAL
jgi:hypothetical protein